MAVAIGNEIGKCQSDVFFLERMAVAIGNDMVVACSRDANDEGPTDGKCQSDERENGSCQSDWNRCNWK